VVANSIKYPVLPLVIAVEITPIALIEAVRGERQVAKRDGPGLG
jgi:hypothetical protein